MYSSVIKALSLTLLVGGFMSAQSVAQALKMPPASREKVAAIHPESSPKKSTNTTKSKPILGAQPKTTTQPMATSKMKQGCDPWQASC